MKYLSLLLVLGILICGAAPAFAAKEKPVGALVTDVIAVDPVTGDAIEYTEVDVLLAEAHQSFLKGEMDKASNGIKKAAAELEKKSAKLGKDAKSAMKASAAELKKLAKDVKKGAIKSADELKAAVEKAKSALPKAKGKKK